MFSGMACFPTLSGHTRVHFKGKQRVQHLQPEDRTDFGGGECHEVTRSVRRV